MTGISRSRASARTARSTSKPFIPGMKTSSVIASKCSWRSRASASVPECTCTVSIPSGLSCWAMSAASAGSSSTMSTRRADSAAGVALVGGRWREAAEARRRGQPDGERRPDADRALHVDRAAVQVDERLDDRQPEAGAGALALVRRAAVEAVEQPPRLLGRDAAPGVGDGDRRRLGVGLEAQRDRALLRRVEVRVRDEVRHDLADPRRVGERRRARVVDLQLEALALGLQARLDHRRDLRDGLAQVDAARVDLELAGLDAGDVEQVVDELGEPVGRLQRDVDELELALGEVLVVGRLEQLDEALDRRQRAAQLVRRGGDEVALGLLQARALGDVAQRPHDAAVGARQARGGDGEREVALAPDRRPRARARRRPAAAGCPGRGRARRRAAPGRARSRAGSST